MKTQLVGFFDWYIVHDRQRVEAALKRVDGVERVDDGEWRWHEITTAGRRHVATLELVGEHLVLEAAREDDADRYGARLQSAGGEALEFMIGEERHKRVGIDGH